ncbi:hypothetical protein HHL22_16110 [Hymenobacter sp. RP-2-7]|uniref:DUF2281 domain-containing protein n=1 Tax=Hymenobacter polaris TaxID=2682546 RepID=A0A7Y0FNB1_9BACT|nr:hypothetical protein [Hymenobacter polaris]NML66733.1 hypothetical protein [Hymenobacter polaris]
MTKQAIITRTAEVINQLPDAQAAEISDFVEFILKRYEEHKLTQGIQKLTAESQAFAFLHDEAELYTEADLKEVYDG